MVKHLLKHLASKPFVCVVFIPYFEFCTYFVVVDIDECQTDNDGCTQVCENIIGSYQCSCWDGYELNDDNYMCTGQCSCSYCISVCMSVNHS